MENLGVTKILEDEAQDERTAKRKLREEIWREMDALGISRFPGAFGRIPNFQGAEKAAGKLAGLPMFQRAKAVKVNPDSPQNPVRRIILTKGKLLIMPSPKLRKGFLVLNPKRIPESSYRKAATIRGAFKYGKPVGLEEIPKIELIVAGSVAVSLDGARIGKGGGYSEIEYGILRELGLVGEETLIVTTVHDSQVIETVPVEDHDLFVDVVITPTRVIRIKRKRKQPKGILWDRITTSTLKEMPILRELKNLRMR